MVSSTASTNSTPRFSRRSSYQRPARRYSSVASSSNRTREFTACEGQLRRDGGRRPRPFPWIHRPARVWRGARFREPKPLRPLRDYRLPHHRGWPAAPRRRQRGPKLTRRGPRVEVLAHGKTRQRQDRPDRVGSLAPWASRRRSSDTPVRFTRSRRVLFSDLRPVRGRSDVHGRSDCPCGFGRTRA